MSSSLFYDCYAPYESYPSTVYVNGDKKFGEIKKGDILYSLNYYGIKELVVTKPWHEAKGYCYISLEKKKNINFGPSNCANVFSDSKNNSIIYYDNTIIGTNKESVINEQLKNIENEINNEENRLKNLRNEYEKINKLKE